MNLRSRGRSLSTFPVIATQYQVHGVFLRDIDTRQDENESYQEDQYVDDSASHVRFCLRQHVML